MPKGRRRRGVGHRTQTTVLACPDGAQPAPAPRGRGRKAESPRAREPAEVLGVAAASAAAVLAVGTGAAHAEDLGMGDIWGNQGPAVTSTAEGSRGGGAAATATATATAPEPKVAEAPVPAAKLSSKEQRLAQMQAERAKLKAEAKGKGEAVQGDLGLGDIFEKQKAKVTAPKVKADAPKAKVIEDKAPVDFSAFKSAMPEIPKGLPKVDIPKVDIPKVDIPKDMPDFSAFKGAMPKDMPTFKTPSFGEFKLPEMPAEKPAEKPVPKPAPVAPAVAPEAASPSPSAGTTSLSSKEQRLAQMRAERARMAESSTSVPKPVPVAPPASQPEAPEVSDPEVSEAAKSEALARYEAMRSGGKVKAKADKAPVDFSALKSAMPKSLDDVKALKVPELPKSLPKRPDLSGVQVPDVQLPKVDLQALGLPDVGSELDAQLTKLLGDKKALVYGLGGAIAKLGGNAVGLLRDVYLKADPDTQAKLTAVAAASPALFWVVLAAGRGYAGDVDPLEAFDAMKLGKAVLIDVRDPELAEIEGRPYIKSKARKNIFNVPFEGQWGSGAEMGLVGDARSVATGLLAVRIASLRSLSKGTRVYLIDEKGSENVKLTAKALSGLGFRKVYRVRGGFAQWLRTSGVAVKLAPWGEDAAADTFREDSEALVEATKQGASKALQSALKKPAKVAVPLGVLVGGAGVYFDAPVPFTGGWRARGFAVLLALLAAAYSKAKTYKNPQELVNDLAKLPAAAAVLAAGAEPYLKQMQDQVNAAQASIPSVQASTPSTPPPQPAVEEAAPAAEDGDE